MEDDGRRARREARRRRARGPQPRYAIGTVDKTRSSVPLEQAPPGAPLARDAVRQPPALLPSPLRIRHLPCMYPPDPAAVPVGPRGSARGGGEEE